jgi:hypothetical protein
MIRAASEGPSGRSGEATELKALPNESSIKPSKKKAG